MELHPQAKHLVRVENNNTGQSSCDDADAGYYSLGTTSVNGVVTNLANQQTLCSGGTIKQIQDNLSALRQMLDTTQTVLFQLTDNGCATAEVLHVQQEHTKQLLALHLVQMHLLVIMQMEPKVGFNVASTVTGASTEQERCLEGTWQDQTGQASCKDSTPSYYSLGTQTFNGVVTNQQTSKLHVQQVLTKNLSKVFRMMLLQDTYSNGTVVVNGVAINATDMTPCPAGTYQPDEGTSC